jgi:FlaG/FlaF family flagellin (archaellin)
MNRTDVGRMGNRVRPAGMNPGPIRGHLPTSIRTLRNTEIHTMATKTTMSPTASSGFSTLGRGVLLGVIALGAGQASATVSFFDGVFAPVDWADTTITNADGAASSVVVSQSLVGGNPNEFRRIDMTLIASQPGGAVFSMNVNNNAFYNPGSQGAITFIDYSEDSINFLPNSGNGQATGLLIVQSGKTYVQRNPVLVMPHPAYANWTANGAPGLTASDLWEVSNTGIFTSTSNPDFSAAGGVMQLGFYRGASSGNFTGTAFREAGIDNWSVRIVPTPATSALLGSFGLMAVRRRRRAS